MNKSRIILGCSIVILIAVSQLFITYTPEPRKNIFDGEANYTIGPAQFIKAHTLIRTKDGMDKPEYVTGDVYKELKKARNKAKSINNSAVYNWMDRGPGNVGGRTRGLVVDPDDPTALTWYLASVGGGVWRTTDAGETWAHLTEELTSLASSTIAMAASNTDVIYVGTGEGFSNLDAIVGTGIWKSTDRGDTWTVLESTMNIDFSNITRLIVDPNDENIVIVSTRTDIGSGSSRIWKSIDGGETWESKFSSGSNHVQQLVASPQDFNILYGCVNRNGVIQSTDAGETWAYIWRAPNNERRIEMAISNQDDGVIYLSCELEEGSRLYFTRDTFDTVIEPIFDGRKPNWLANQGWYDNTVAVHPYNDSLVWLAGQGTLMQIKPGKEDGTVVAYDRYRNRTFFVFPIDNSPVIDRPAGLAIDLFEGIPLDLANTSEDLINVEIQFGPDKSSKAHLIYANEDELDIRYTKMIDVPFEAWDTTNNRQIALSIIDGDDNGEWSFDNYSSLSNPVHDAVVTNNVDYTETPHPIISTNNPLYKAQYYVFMGRSPIYSGPQDTLPAGTIMFETKEETGLVSTFTPIADGYSTYSEISNVGSKGVHVDHHNIVMIPRDSATGAFYILNANDGGIAFSDDNGETFKQTGDAFNNRDGQFETLKGYNTAQFYGVDKKNGEDRFVAGTQDNGSWVSPADPDDTSEWVHAPSGDGFEAAWNYDNTDLIIESSQFNRIYKSRDEGASWRRVNLPDSRGPFITRLASSQLNSGLLLMSSSRGVLRSEDFGDSWDITVMPALWEFNESWGPPLAISLADPMVAWTGSAMEDDSRICFSLDGGKSFDWSSEYTRATLGTVTGITTHPNDPSTAYVVFSQKNAPKVLMTEDLGNTWQDLSGFVTNKEESSNGFPNVAVYSLLVMPWEENRMWAGTEIGIFESMDGGESWVFADNGLPPVSVWQMKIVNDEIVVATHGRGIWTLNISELLPSAVNELATQDATQLKVFPNPITQSSTISYTLTQTQNVHIQLMTADGKVVQEIYRGAQSSGDHDMVWSRGALVSGLYVVQMRTENGMSSRKVFLE